MRNQPLKLLVAYDGSKGADAALDDLQHAGLPRKGQVEVLIFSLADRMSPIEGLPVPPSSTHAYSAQVAGVAALISHARHDVMEAIEEMQVVANKGRDRLRALFPEWEIEGAAWADSPAWGLLKKEDEWHPDLTLVGANSGSLAKKMIFGSIAQKVVTKACGSVRVGRFSDRGAHSSVRLILGMDGSPDAQGALDAICARSFPPGSEVRVVTVLDGRMASGTTTLLPMLARWVEEGGKNREASDGSAGGNGEFGWIGQMEREAVTQLRAAGLEANWTTQEGDSKEVLLDEAQRWGADCIFIGAKGLVGSSGLQNMERFFLGSTATVVSSRATCSVEVIRTPAPRAPQGDNS